MFGFQIRSLLGVRGNTIISPWKEKNGSRGEIYGYDEKNAFLLKGMFVSTSEQPVEE